MLRVVAIGGGTGLSCLLRGMKQYVPGGARAGGVQPQIRHLTAVVTVTDEGGSSGRLRRDLRMLPPGDIRNCLTALAEDEKLMTQLFQYRFARGHGLRGHSLGNLFLAALTHLTRDFHQAVRLSSEVLAIRGEIVPSTLADVRLKARLRDGRVIYGESRITRTRVPIRRLQIVPARCRPLPETLAAIESADLITLGPGSLYTSLIPNLLVRGIPQAIRQSKAVKVFVCNLMTQPGETRGYSASAHLRAVADHVGEPLFDYVALNTRPLSRRLARRYEAQRAGPVANDLEAVSALGVRPVLASLLVEDGVARHDPGRLARLLLKLARQRRERGSAARAAGHPDGRASQA
jgi:uncharacterized cofD-like protein